MTAGWEVAHDEDHLRFLTEKLQAELGSTHGEGD